MEIIDRRTSVAEPEAEPAEQFDQFKPTLAGFVPLGGAILLRELKLPDESAIMTPDAFAEPSLYCEVIAGTAPSNTPIHIGNIARILKGIGHTIKFSDQAEGQRYFTVNHQDIIGMWRRQ